MTQQMNKEGFAVGGGASGQSFIPDPVDVGNAHANRKADKDQGDKQAMKVADVTPQGPGPNVEANRASIVAKGNPAAIRTQSMESVKEIFKGQELSEEFVSKAATIFEAVLGQRVAAAEQDLSSQYSEKLEASIIEMRTKMVEQVDSYMDYAVKEWMEENKLELESGLKAEITEDFITGLRTLFEENHINIPDEKVDVVEELVAKVEELEEKLNVSINENLELRKFKDGEDRKDLVDTMSEGLSTQQKEKFQSLMENVAAENVEEFSAKAKTIKEEYFGVKTPAKKAETLTEQTEKDTPVETPETTKKIEDPAMARYSEAIKRTVIK